MIAWIFAGQGSQKRGMGEGLFARFPDITRQADAILGYSIEKLCLEDPDDLLGLTQYTQPALYTVNALYMLEKRADGAPAPAMLAGHSLGEYNALLAAESFDFAAGLRLVKERGALMGEAKGGRMAAVMASGADTEAALQKHGLDTLDVANFNSPKQTVVAGPVEALDQAAAALKGDGLRVIPLNVSAPFHSRYMAPSQEAFGAVLRGEALAPPQIPVVANLTARPYEAGSLFDTLVGQIGGGVRWRDSVDYMLDQGVTEFVEFGPKPVLTSAGQ